MREAFARIRTTADKMTAKPVETAAGTEYVFDSNRFLKAEIGVSFIDAHVALYYKTLFFSNILYPAVKSYKISSLSRTL
jgi:hypothetical protein